MCGMASTLLTAKQVAEELGVSYESVLRWAREGDLQSIRLPRGSVRFRREDVEKLLRPPAATA